MIYILLSISCSVTVSILLKLARRYHISIVQAVTWNYIFAILLAVIFFKPQMGDLKITDYSIYVSLGILLPVVFWILARSIRTTGIARTDIAQRLSLIIPLLAAYFVFQEQFNAVKLAGIALGFISILLILSVKKTTSQPSATYVYPVLVFLGFGCVDILFKKIAVISGVPYTTSLVVVFCCSAVISLIATVYLVVAKKEKLQLVNILCGFILGCFNFGNIFFYLKAHQAFASNPSTVFASMNIGVITLGCLIGVFAFKERLTKFNLIGLIVAVLAVVLITVS
ncbi:EamA family transporter [Pedobacter duraquae]|uniref:EamA-like transporter family protein n=1 Tax=Pedobacter duraquae TaxID=425511 RepID=A0A4R6IFW2_9SPHI|nr:EamA family transporter [Pedobacter duraquae]TDO20631.1 EamA-like transporter family protein [Pedobacter duraquae]